MRPIGRGVDPPLSWPAWIRTKTKWTKTTCATFTPRANARSAIGVTRLRSAGARGCASASGRLSGDDRTVRRVRASLLRDGRAGRDPGTLDDARATVAGARGRSLSAPGGATKRKPVRGRSSEAGAPARPRGCSMRGLRVQSSTAHLGRADHHSGSGRGKQRVDDGGAAAPGCAACSGRWPKAANREGRGCPRPGPARRWRGGYGARARPAPIRAVRWRTRRRIALPARCFGFSDARSVQATRDDRADGSPEVASIRPAVVPRRPSDGGCAATASACRQGPRASVVIRRPPEARGADR